MQEKIATSGVSTLILRNYRLFKYQEFNLDSNLPVIIVGENGSGKTTILEALSLLNGGRGLRSSNFSQMISTNEGFSNYRFNNEADIKRNLTLNNVNSDGLILNSQIQESPENNNNGFSVRVSLASSDDIFDLSYKEQGGVNLLHQKKKISSRKALKGIINTSWLTPQYSFQFVSNLQLRLKTIDRLISMSDYDHMSEVSALARLLKDRIYYIRQDACDNNYLDALETDIAKKISAITVARMIFCEKLDKYMQEVKYPFPRGNIIISGEVCRLLKLNDATSAEEIIEKLLYTSRKDIKNSYSRYQMSLHKPKITFIDTQLNQEMLLLSTGQQQSLLFTFLYASICYFMHNLPGSTLLLLDDVFSHLDSKRRNAITDTFMQMPIYLWMTGVEKTLFRSISGNCQTINLKCISNL